MPKGAKHERYEVLNLIGYGLSKFDLGFVEQFGFETKSAFYERIVSLGIADTPSTVKNRMDLFDGMVPMETVRRENRRVGWRRPGQDVNGYEHRKDALDSIFGDLDAGELAAALVAAIEQDIGREMPLPERAVRAQPIFNSMFKALQRTGLEAETYFMSNYQVGAFQGYALKDARLLGDGYDFQMGRGAEFLLAEVKGVRQGRGGVRMTEREFRKAEEFRDEYVLVVVSGLDAVPRMMAYRDPAEELEWRRSVTSNEDVWYSSGAALPI